MISLLRSNSYNTDFTILTKSLDEELNQRYGVLQKSFDKLNIIDCIDTTVLLFYNNQPIGCGCFKRYSKNTVEIKRVYLMPSHRGKSLAQLILEELEKWAIELGFINAILETGIKQPDAIRFYTKNNYFIIENYGNYIGNQNSICMKKALVEF